MPPVSLLAVVCEAVHKHEGRSFLNEAGIIICFFFFFPLAAIEAQTNLLPFVELPLFKTQIRKHFQKPCFALFSPSDSLKWWLKQLILK